MADDKPTDIKVTDLPLTMHEGHWTTVHDDFRADEAVVSLRLAHEAVRMAYESSLRTHRAVMADPLQTEAANLQRSANHAHKRQAEALTKVDAALDRARRTLAAIDEATSRPADPPSPEVSKLISSRLLSMSADDRQKVIAEALATDDEDSRQILGAALSFGPALIYGLSKSERDMYRARYQQLRFPAALARKAAIEKAIGITNAGGTSLISSVSKLIDAGAVRRAQELAAVARSALS